MELSMNEWFDRYHALANGLLRSELDAVWQDIAVLQEALNAATSDSDGAVIGRALLRLARAALYRTSRKYDDALRELGGITLNVKSSYDAARTVLAMTNLEYGYVLHSQKRHDEAATYFEYVVQEEGRIEAILSGDAHYTLAQICSIQGAETAAYHHIERAGVHYLSTKSYGKFAMCLHQLGNIYKGMKRLDDAVKLYASSLEYFRKVGDKSGELAVTDDWARLVLAQAAMSTDETERDKLVEYGFGISIDTAYVAAELWRECANDEGRLADLSERLLHHTMTHVEYCRLTKNAHFLFGALAVSKGRIRAVNSPLPRRALESAKDWVPNEIARNADPRAYFELIMNATRSLNPQNEVIAVVDQLGIYGDQLISAAWLIAGTEIKYHVATSALRDPDEIELRRSMRGQDRCAGIEQIASRLSSDIRNKHSMRCSYLLGDNWRRENVTDLGALELWSNELNDDLAELGGWFFPPDLLEFLAEFNTNHVVLVPDPLFAHVPYCALETSRGMVLDQNWTLTQLTSSVELVRLSHRNIAITENRPLSWFGPDADVNARLGGNVELSKIQQFFPIESFREDAATIENVLRVLESKRWAHFRGHGHFDDDVATTGPVFATNEILNRNAFERISTDGGFLFTAACSTASATSIGTEPFGSLVDYDRAGLAGVVLTLWPIPGPASVAFVERFYSSLADKRHVGVALQHAARETRILLPHPYFWAPFVAMGTWQMNAPH